MFLTGAAIDAWKARIIDNPIFLLANEIANLKKPNRDVASKI
jgi:hypothetical protein